MSTPPIRIKGCPPWCQVGPAQHLAQILGEDRLAAGFDPAALEHALAVMYEGDVPPRRLRQMPESVVHWATWADGEGRWSVEAGLVTDAQGQLEEMPHLVVGCDHLGLSCDEARALAAAILEAADALDATALLG